MSIKEKIYFCSNCKKIFNDIDSLLFVESKSSRGFCSEKCIESFFNHVVLYYESVDRKIRDKFGLLNERCLSHAGDPKYIEQVLRNPDEIWMDSNSLNEDYYSLISKVEEDDGPVYFIILCFMYNKRPSFIILTTVTKDVDFVNEFRVGNSMDTSEYKDTSDEIGMESLQLDPEIITGLENKKSILIAELLQDRNDKDVPFEEFYLYEEVYQATLETPDEVYWRQDDDGDILYTYIKSHERDGIAYYYFVICMKVAAEWKGMHETLLPVLSFPSTESDIYKKYRLGEIVSGITMN